MQLITLNGKFPLGDIVITANAMAKLSKPEINGGLYRHANGDWGNLCSEDVDQNKKALESGRRIFSSYGEGSKRFWIITEADRSVTTILLPQDY